jgi:hypothetical protein
MSKFQKYDSTCLPNPEMGSSGQSSYFARGGVGVCAQFGSDIRRQSV